VGVIKRQGIKGTIVSYLGILIGYLNLMVIFPVFLEKDQIGLISVLIGAASLIAVFSQMGMSNTIIRFFPNFRDDERNHRGLMVWMILVPGAGYLLFLLLWFLFRDEILRPYVDQSPLLVQHANWLLPMSLFMMFSLLLESWSSLFQRITTPRIIRELGLKLMATLSVVLYGKGVIDFSVFLIMFAGSYAIGTVLLSIYLMQLGRWHLKPDWAFMTPSLRREMAVYSFFIILGGVGSSLITRVDQIMLSELAGLESVAIYTIAMSMAVVIEIPMRAMMQISAPIVAEAVAANDKTTLLALYQKSSITQLVAGGLIFGGVWVNVENIFGVMPRGQEFLAGKYVIFWIGLSKLFDLATSINGIIVNNSRYYRVSLYLMALLALLAIISNRIFIPEYGVNGAAFATALSLLLYNAMMLLFVWYKFHLQPFQWNTLKLIGVFLFALWVNSLLPGQYLSPEIFLSRIPDAWVSLVPVLMDLFLRSILFFVVFAGLCWGLKISPDLNDTIKNLINRLLKVFA
jgi:O-antigen/teichoic acid export membrane protein